MEHAVELAREEPAVQDLEPLLAALEQRLAPAAGDHPLSVDLGPMGTQLCVRGPCNLACLFCNLALDRREVDEAAHEAALTAEVDRLARQGVSAMSWGIFHHEPTTFDGLPRLLRHARARGVAPSRVVTNGIRTADPAYCRELRDAGADGLVVTLCEHDRQSADLLCQGEGVLAARRRTFENCRDLGLEVFPVLLLMRANYQHLGAALDLYGDLLDTFTLQPVQPTMGERVPWFLPPLSGVMEVVAAEARQRPHLTLTLVNMPACIRRRHGPDLPNLRHRADRQGVIPPACGGCREQDGCCGFAAEYLEQYGDGEATAAEARHDPLPLEELKRRCDMFIRQRRQEHRLGDGVVPAATRRLLDVVEEILGASPDTKISVEGPTLAHHERVAVVVKHRAHRATVLLAWRRADQQALVNAGPFALMLPRGEEGPGPMKLARALARVLLQGWRRGPGAPNSQTPVA